MTETRLRHKAHVLDPGDVIFVEGEPVEITEVYVVAKTTAGKDLRFKPDDVLDFQNFAEEQG